LLDYVSRTLFSGRFWVLAAAAAIVSATTTTCVIVIAAAAVIGIVVILAAAYPDKDYHDDDPPPIVFAHNGVAHNLLPPIKDYTSYYGDGGRVVTVGE